MYVKFHKPVFIDTLRTMEDNASPWLYFQEFAELFDLKDTFFILLSSNNSIVPRREKRVTEIPEILILTCTEEMNVCNSDVYLSYVFIFLSIVFFKFHERLGGQAKFLGVLLAMTNNTRISQVFCY